MLTTSYALYVISIFREVTKIKDKHGFRDDQRDSIWVRDRVVNANRIVISGFWWTQRQIGESECALKSLSGCNLRSRGRLFQSSDPWVIKSTFLFA